MKHIGILIICIITAAGLSCGRQQDEEYAMVMFVIGDVSKNGKAVEIGELIQQKDSIQTEKNAFCDIKIGSSIIRIKEKSKVVISNLVRNVDAEKTTVDIGIGKMMCKPKKLLRSDSFVIKSPTAVAGVRGTQFSVEVDQTETTRIKVFDGKVQTAKRVMQLDNDVDKVLASAPSLGVDEKVIITKKDALEAEALVEKVMAKESLKIRDHDALIASIIQKTKSEVVMSAGDIQKFSVDDFEKDNKEMIDIKPKSKEVIEKIADFVKKEKDAPKSDGRLLITRYEIYFIKNGQVLWEGKVVSDPVRDGEKLYIASGDYVYCANSDGPVLWRKNIENKGKLELKNNILKVFAEDKEISLDPETGEKL